MHGLFYIYPLQVRRVRTTIKHSYIGAHFMNKAVKKKGIDWIAIENAFRLNTRSNREIAELYGCSESAVRKKSLKEAWTRDLSKKIATRTDEKVRNASIREEVRKSRNLTDEVVIEETADLRSNVILTHRTDIQRHRRLALSMLSELEAMTDHQDVFENLGEMLIDTKGDSDEKNKAQESRLRALNAALSISGRVDSMKKLSDSLKNLIALERQAFDLDAAVEENPLRKLDTPDIDARIILLLNKAKINE